MTRFLVLPFVFVLAFAQSGCTQSKAERPEVMVYKSPTCGCCSKWVAHLENAGFAVTTADLRDLGQIKKKFGVPAGLRSCHTAIVDGYVVEGHVPADVIKKMLEEKPDIAGIAVPGMPIGSPGMEQGSRVDSYRILTFDRKGGTTVYATR